jgi:membrane-associated phospholipid phosphatase
MKPVAALAAPSAFSALLLLAAPAACADGLRRSGDVLSYALPGAVLAAELDRGDRQGARQMAGTFVLSVGATEVLKRTLRIPRPDGSDEFSFPSGHAARAFSAAAYVQRRHGMDKAWPLFAAAGYVGYTRVEAQRHRWVDVAGSAAVALVAARLVAGPKHPAPPSLAVAPATSAPLLAYTVRW